MTNEQRALEIIRAFLQGMRDALLMTLGWAAATMPIESIWIRALIVFVVLLFIPRARTLDKVIG